MMKITTVTYVFAWEETFPHHLRPAHRQVRRDRESSECIKKQAKDGVRKGHDFPGFARSGRQVTTARVAEEPRLKPPRDGQGSAGRERLYQRCSRALARQRGAR